MMFDKKNAETRLELLLSVKKKLNKESAFKDAESGAHDDVLRGMFDAIDQAINYEVLMLGSGRE